MALLKIHRLASIVWNWDRIISVTRLTSIAFRFWIFITFVINFMAAVVATINLSTHLEQFPQHLEMYIPAVVNVIISFYILFIGAQIAHMNTVVDKCVYFLLAATHFAHVEIKHIDDTKYKRNNKRVYGNIGSKNNGHLSPLSDDAELQIDDIGNMDDEDLKEDEESVEEQMLIQARQQNLYAQAQTVAKTSSTMQIGIAVYGMVLHRNLFLAFFAPFIAFFAFCLNEWLPKGI